MANDFSGDANCVALWRMESGALTTDSKGTNTLTDVNTVQENTADFKEGACCADLELTNAEYFSIADASLDAGFPLKSGDTTKIISLCYWVKAESWAATNVIYAKWESSTSLVFRVNHDAIGQLFVYIGYNGGISFESKNHASAMGVAKWYHVGIVLDGPNKTILIRIWDDTAGAILGTDIDTTYTNVIDTEATALRIGAQSYLGYPYYFDGLLDEMVVFKDKLTAAEIDQIRAGTYGAAGGLSIPGFFGSTLSPVLPLIKGVNL